MLNSGDATPVRISKIRRLAPLSSTDRKTLTENIKLFGSPSATSEDRYQTGRKLFRNVVDNHVPHYLMKGIYDAATSILEDRTRTHESRFQAMEIVHMSLKCQRNPQALVKILDAQGLFNIFVTQFQTYNSYAYSLALDCMTIGCQKSPIRALRTPEFINHLINRLFIHPLELNPHSALLPLLMDKDDEEFDVLIKTPIPLFKVIERHFASTKTLTLQNGYGILQKYLYKKHPQRALNLLIDHRVVSRLLNNLNFTASIYPTQVEYSLKALIHIAANGSLEVSQALLRKGLIEKVNEGWNVLIAYDQFKIFKAFMLTNDLISDAFIKNGQIISELIHGLYRRADSHILYLTLSTIIHVCAALPKSAVQEIIEAGAGQAFYDLFLYASSAELLRTSPILLYVHLLADEFMMKLLKPNGLAQLMSLPYYQNIILNKELFDF